MQIKAAFFDIDGTLLSHKLKAVPQSALDTIEQMQKKGILCVAATGRSIMEFNRLPTRGFEWMATLR
ncbi:HAD hydrolase family protein [Allobaculum sp. Allo2]|uniref:HAD hydrolase family protein n=1 Tax=Allobaculum sp. Allo2 TaxID=2853432 RepID=UPI002113212D|nr:HAD hydrolase family protein [Allobaculum sp. Allo2]UNT94195.1 HAD hydrolase family protein [Allobaculum sp. Allo2]